MKLNESANHDQEEKLKGPTWATREKCLTRAPAAPTCQQEASSNFKSFFSNLQDPKLML